MAIDIRLIEALLQRVENETLDFKQAQYDFTASPKKDQKRKRAEFVKDIVSMYNTPRAEIAYIVLGIHKNLDGTVDVIGVSSHIDDAELRSKFEDWIHPVPRFYYEPAEYRGKQIAVICIPPNQTTGPCLPLKDLPNSKSQLLRRHQLYVRSGSVNSAAGLADQKASFAWFAGQQNDERSPPEGPWELFLDEVREFGPDYYYGLVVPQLDSDSDNVTENLSYIDWTMVIDFDKFTDAHGLLSRCREHLQTRRTVHLVKRGDSPTVNIGRGTYWYCVAGLLGHSTTIPKSEKWVDWNRMYGSDLSRFVNLIAAASAARPMVLVAFWDSGKPVEYLSAVMKDVTAGFGDTVHIVIVVPKASPEIRQLSTQFETPVFEIPLQQFCLGLKQLAPQQSPGGKNDVVLPSTSGAPQPISAEKLTWLSEEIRILHLGEGRQAPDAHNPGSEFLRGNEITWYDLGLNYDVSRDIADKVEKTIRSDLGKRRPLRVNLYHAAGAGGTTVSRRVLWNLRKDFPCLLLRRTNPAETIERLAYIASLTKKPILLAIDGGAITDREADALYERAAASHIPVVLFQVLRRHGKPPQQRRAFFLDSQLSSLEAERFVHYLEREVPNRSSELRKVLVESNPKTLTPFYFALVAFGRDFVKLPEYIERRLDGLTSVQKDCIAFLAMAHYFGQRAIPAQMFADYFSMPVDLSVKFEELLPSSLLEILIESELGVWRTVHQVIARECMRQIFTSVDADQDIWTQRLSQWSLRFIEFCRGHTPVASEDGLDLVRRVFVFRGNSEILGSERAGSSKFSDVIERIPAREGRLKVLEHLTGYFPDEAHFWAHLGRFYSSALCEYDKACEAVEYAIGLQPDDHVLHHMKGMVLRSQIYQMISNKRDLSEIVSKAEAAADAFTKARELDPDDEHGYISEAQMILRVIDYCGVVKKTAPVLVASSGSSPKWVRESVQNVEELLAQVRHNRKGEHPSRFEEDCMAKLDILYGDHSTALQRWDSMLVREDVYRPPIRRQIVWAYLARRRRDWNDLKPNELKRAVTLLSTNLDEEPNNERNLRLWLQAVRAGENPPSIDSVVEKIFYWHSNSDSLEPAYYLFVLYSLKAFEGSSLARDKANRVLDECRARSRYRRNRTKSFEWIARGEGLKRLLHQDALGEWDRDCQFWSDPSPLDRLNGVVSHIQGPEAGEIETTSGLKAFYAPGPAGHHQGETENRRVTFYIGFSYDGLRAWDVKTV